jgi:GTPase SAR1 family protein
MAKVTRKSAYDVVAKVVILGDSAVGKTNILLRFTEN